MLGTISEMHFAFDEVGPTLWDANKPRNANTDKRVLNKFLPTKQISLKLWDFCDQTLEINFVLVHVPGMENPAAEHLFRLNITP